jgi:hypothetical protein
LIPRVATSTVGLRLGPQHLGALESTVRHAPSRQQQLAACHFVFCCARASLLVHLAEAASDGRRAADESVRFAANAQSTGCQSWDAEKRMRFCSFISEPTVNVPLTLTNALRFVLMGPTGVAPSSSKFKVCRASNVARHCSLLNSFTYRLSPHVTALEYLYSGRTIGCPLIEKRNQSMVHTGTLRPFFWQNQVAFQKLRQRNQGSSVLCYSI